MVKDDMRARWGVDESRIDLVPNGCDVDRFRPAGADERAMARGRFAIGMEETALLLVTHNWRLRGLEPLVAAVSALYGKWRLLLAGRGVPDDIATTARVRPLGPLEDPRPAYAAADLLVHPTFYDPCSLTTLEALASGLPVVTTRWNGAAELFSGDEGIIVDDPRDAMKLKEAIEALAAPARRTAAQAAARATAERHPKSEALARLCTIVEKAAPRPASEAPR
jgi:UDP-glucose:(heptosyl)LPS alpha-1,3-glucosyltransferase